jgi:hypothetical protein
MGNVADPRPIFMWLRSTVLSNADNVQHVTNANSLATDGGGMSPTLWLLADMEVKGFDGTSGTYASPFCVDMNDPFCNTPPPAPTITSPIMDSLQNNVLTLAGSVAPDADGDTVTVYYQLNGTAGPWQGPILLNSGAFVSTIDISGLTPGNNVIYVRSFDGIDYSTANAMTTFQVPSRYMQLAVMANQPFDFRLGVAGAFNITPGTNGGVTVGIDGDDYVNVSGTLAEDAELVFGPTTLRFNTLDTPTTQAVNVTFP